MIGIDLIPAQPPRGVATFQGDFLSPMVQKLVKEFIARTASQKASLKNKGVGVEAGSEEPVLDQPSYIDRERHASEEVEVKDAGESAASSVDVSFFFFFLLRRAFLFTRFRGFHGSLGVYFSSVVDGNADYG